MLPKIPGPLNIEFHQIAGLFRANHCPENTSELAEAAVCHHLGDLHRHLLEDRGPVSDPQPQARRLVRRDLHQPSG